MITIARKMLNNVMNKDVKELFSPCFDHNTVENYKIYQQVLKEKFLFVLCSISMIVFFPSYNYDIRF